VGTAEAVSIYFHAKITELCAAFSDAWNLSEKFADAAGLP
jgi:hypothetical protein